MMIDGVLVQGAQNIFFAELASKSTTQFSVAATRFMSGKFPFMIFGLPGAALAMYSTARSEKKRVAGGLLLSASLTAMLTGITEPIEFTFLFIAPVLYFFHSLLAGVSYMLMHLLEVGVGMTFSGGVIDLLLFGVLQGNEKTGWVSIIPVGIAYFIIYFLLFRFMIRRFDYMTPGREVDGETKLYTRADYNAQRGGAVPEIAEDPSLSDAAVGKEDTSSVIVRGLGGIDNIRDIDCCATRLRVTVSDGSLVVDELLRASGAAGVIRHGNGVQVVYGPSVSVIKSELDEFIEENRRK
jgi:PTS system D-glucosamine-specific IIC component